MPGKTQTASAPKKAKAAAWRSLPKAAKLAHLLASPNICDRAHSDVPREKGENRETYLRRLYGPAKRVKKAA